MAGVAAFAGNVDDDPEGRERDERQDGGEWFLGSDLRRRSSRIHKLQARAGCFDKDKVTEKVLRVAKDA